MLDNYVNGIISSLFPQNLISCEAHFAVAWFARQQSVTDVGRDGFLGNSFIVSDGDKMTAFYQRYSWFSFYGTQYKMWQMRQTFDNLLLASTSKIGNKSMALVPFCLFIIIKITGKDSLDIGRHVTGFRVKQFPEGIFLGIGSSWLWCVCGEGMNQLIYY